MQSRKFSRSLTNRTFGGVCGGLGMYLGVNAWWIRLTFMVFALFNTGVSIVLYVLLWFSLPEQNITELAPGDPSDQGQVSAETLVILGSGVVMLGIVVLAVSLGVFQGSRSDVLLPFVIIGLGGVLLAQQLRRPA